MVAPATIRKLTESIDELERRFKPKVIIWQDLAVSDEDARRWIEKQGLKGDVMRVRWSRGPDSDGRPT